MSQSILVEDDPAFPCYMAMRSRCLNPKTEGYKRYGGRGITICERWLKGFRFFIDDMGPRPSPRHTIERIDNNGNYEPGNCRWATPKEQARNRSNNSLIEFQGKKQTLIEWAEEMGIDKRTLRTRIVELGWGIEQALTVKPEAGWKRYKGVGDRRQFPSKRAAGPELIAEIRERRKSGEKVGDIAKSLSLNFETITSIIHGTGTYAGT